MKSPREYGLAEKFQSWRPTQEAALDFLNRSTKRVKALSMPTGSGKGAVYVAKAKESKLPTAIVTDSKALQDLLISEHPGIADLRGRQNYQCKLREEDPEYTCEQGHAAQCPYQGKPDCDASRAEMKAATSYLVVTNYPKWIHNRRFGQGLSHVERVVFDEAHESYNALAKSMQITLHSKEVAEILKMDFPPTHEAHFFSCWREWAQKARIKGDIQLAKWQRDIRDLKRAKTAHVKRYVHLRNLCRHLTVLATANPNNWIVEELSDGRGYQFDPISPARYAEYALLLKVPDITFISATLTPKTLYMVGIKKEDYDYIDFPSDFDPKRCPIYYTPTMPVAYGADLTRLWIKHDQIAGRRRDRNGVTHSVSFDRRDDILAQSRFASSMVTNQKGESTTDAIANFVRQYPGAIFVSPSVGQGFDFAFKAAEWQFISKVPFPPPSKIQEARKERDKEYPFYITGQKLSQIAGRIMRDHKDQGETFIADDQMDWFMRSYKHLTSRAFRQFYQQISVLPPPPERLR